MSPGDPASAQRRRFSRRATPSATPQPSNRNPPVPIHTQLPGTGPGGLAAFSSAAEATSVGTGLSCGAAMTWGIAAAEVGTVPACGRVAPIREAASGTATVAVGTAPASTEAAPTAGAASKVGVPPAAEGARIGAHVRTDGVTIFDVEF